MPKEAGALEEGAVEEPEVEGGSEEEEFDKERAMATIEKQREAESKAKKEAADLRAELEKYKTAEEEQEEAEKALEVKLSERDATVQALEKTIADLHVQHDFVGRAANRGIEDPALAYLAAKEQGLLGEYDPKEGKVSDHDFDELGEQYPSFKGTGVAQTGDAGKRKMGKAQTVNDQFNSSVRERLGR